MSEQHSHININEPLSLETLLKYRDKSLYDQKAQAIAQMIGGSVLYTEVADGLDQSTVDRSRAIANRVSKRIESGFEITPGKSWVDRYKFHLVAGIIIIAAIVGVFTINPSTEKTTDTAQIEKNEQGMNDPQKKEIPPAFDKDDSDAHTDVDTDINIDSETPATTPENDYKSTGKEDGMIEEKDENPSTEKEEKEKQEKSLRERLLWNSSSDPEGEVAGTKASSGNKSGIKTLGGSDKPVTINTGAVHIEFKENLFVYEQRNTSQRSGTDRTNPNLGSKTTDKVDGFNYSADDLPAYPGGDDKLTEDIGYWIGDIKLPAGTSQKASVSVLVTVNNKGLLDNIEYISDVCEPVQRNINTALHKAGPWSKGKKTGRKGSVIYGIAITFK